MNYLYRVTNLAYSQKPEGSEAALYMVVSAANPRTAKLVHPLSSALLQREGISLQWSEEHQKWKASRVRPMDGFSPFALANTLMMIERMGETAWTSIDKLDVEELGRAGLQIEPNTVFCVER